MGGAVIIDIIIASVLALFIWRGKKKGLWRSLTSLIVIVAALMGASWLASELAAPVSQWAGPLIEEKVEARLWEAIEESRDEGEETPQPVSVFSLMGMDERASQKLSDRVEEEVRQTGADLVGAMLQGVLQAVVYQILFFLLFVLLCLVLHFLVRSLDLVLRLPGLRLLNGVGGAAFGTIQGAVVLFVLFGVLKWLGISIPAEILEKTYLTWIFAEESPLALLCWL